MGVTTELVLDPDREEDELRGYLGNTYDRDLLENYNRTLHREFAEVQDEETLYRTSKAYLYNLTAFAMTGTKLPYIDLLMKVVSPGSRVLDYGCGIGSDGLLLLDAGYQVEFADFDNPSTEYLRWRLERRGISAPIHDIDKGVPAGFDAAYSFDVIEHVPDPFGFLGELESRASLVQVNFLEPDENDIHRDLPLAKLQSHVAQRNLVSYRILHTTSHLATYRPERVGTPRRTINAARIQAARLNRRLAPA